MRHFKGLAASYYTAAGAYLYNSDTAKAHEAAEAGVAIMKRLVALEPDNPKWRDTLAVYENHLEYLFANSPSPDEAPDGRGSK